ncbi:sporulation integral membrane protein YtvI [Dehalobacter sp. TeCB1]|uniref:sporulation integral membrane protein YtvI n=1 Tax=Dehalobacter sp. TeCB1 TaxID=1843715 RepID=UPI00083A86A4|nr:sporulation integral membrane protein YtvI [Dehalobacter sp. TeCB1]OCZ49707.1 sporulation integral membrane protein YtvI [Dehalobacter sp. TeCB1]
MSNLLDYSKKVFIAVLIIVATLVIPYGLYKILPHFMPFVLAYLTALFLEPAAAWLSKVSRFKSKTLSVSVTYLFFLTSIVIFLYLIISKLYVQLLDLLDFIQSNGPAIQVWFLNLTGRIQETIGLLPPEINDMIMKWINDLANINLVSAIGSSTLSISTAIPNMFFLSIIYLVSVFLFTFQLSNIHRFFYSFFKDSSKLKVAYVLSDLRNATLGFFKAQIILSTITYIIAFAGLAILHVKYVAVISLLIVIVDILPILGTGSVLMPWAVVSLFQDRLFLAAGLVILYIIIIVVRRVIEPKILGERIGLSALTTLISIWIGFKVMGVLGVFLFPLACIFYRALVKVGVIKLNFKI